MPKCNHNLQRKKNNNEKNTNKIKTHLYNFCKQNKLIKLKKLEFCVAFLNFYFKFRQMRAHCS